MKSFKANANLTKKSNKFPLDFDGKRNTLSFMTRSMKSDLKKTLQHLTNADPEYAVEQLDSLLKFSRTLTPEQRKYIYRAKEQAESGSTVEAENIITLFLLS